jgi:uncharacterized protein
MLFNVSQLLRETVGSSRDYVLEAEGRIRKGRARLTRTPDGVLVQVQAEVMQEAECSRCLTSFGYPEEISFDEVFVQQVDVATGRRIENGGEDDPDAFLISLSHTIDITEAVRQYSEAAELMQPLCRVDCPGICQSCGEDLSMTKCDCDTTPQDSRWAALAALKRSNG